MAKWVLDTYRGKNTWYSSDVIHRIEGICRRNICDYDECYPDCECLPKKILDIIESEDKFIYCRALMTNIE